MRRRRGEVGGALVGVIAELEQRRAAARDAANERLAIGNRRRGRSGWGGQRRAARVVEGAPGDAVDACPADGPATWAQALAGLKADREVAGNPEDRRGGGEQDRPLRLAGHVGGRGRADLVAARVVV